MDQLNNILLQHRCNSFMVNLLNKSGKLLNNTPIILRPATHYEVNYINNDYKQLN